jgi:hypothetical protein
VLENTCTRHGDGLFVGEPVRTGTDAGKLIYISEIYYAFLYAAV